MGDYLVKLPAVLARTGLSRSTLYRDMEQGRFPAPVRISLRAVAWRASDIDAWIESLPRTTAGEAAAMNDSD